MNNLESWVVTAGVGVRITHTQWLELKDAAKCLPCPTKNAPPQMSPVLRLRKLSWYPVLTCPLHWIMSQFLSVISGECPLVHQWWFSPWTSSVTDFPVWGPTKQSQGEGCARSLVVVLLHMCYSGLLISLKALNTFSVTITVLSCFLCDWSSWGPQSTFW